MHKYRAKKASADGILFDSKAERLYYLIHKKNQNMKRQETFVLQEKFKLNGKTYRAINYKPDFTFYDDEGNLIKVVDVKGMVLSEFTIKAKLFTKKYGIAITIAKKDSKTNRFVEYQI